MKTYPTRVVCLILLASLSAAYSEAADWDVSDWDASDWNDYYGPIVFKSEKIAKWKIKSRFNETRLESIPGYDSHFNASKNSQLSIRAHRALTLLFEQQIYASFNTTHSPLQYYPEWRYIPEDLGTFTRLGWLVGDESGLNMALEFEHREVGDKENNALTLGVQYFF